VHRVEAGSAATHVPGLRTPRIAARRLRMHAPHARDTTRSAAPMQMPANPRRVGQYAPPLSVKRGRASTEDVLNSILPDCLPQHREAALTRGETFVLTRLRAGASQPKIAADLGNSVHTVRTVVRNIRAKFHAPSVDQLLRGINAGVYTIVEKAVPEPQTFNLKSALCTLERELRLSPDRRMRNVRLHTDELLALLNLAQSYNAAVDRDIALSETIAPDSGRPQE
jgi:DNA-binding CsgD family transcriptional regulator